MIGGGVFELLSTGKGAVQCLLGQLALKSFNFVLSILAVPATFALIGGSMMLIA